MDTVTATAEGSGQSFKFTISNLDDFSALPVHTQAGNRQAWGPAFVTERFGPGLFFRLRLRVSADSKRSLAISLASVKDITTPALSISWEAKAVSRTGEVEYCSRPVCSTLQSGGGPSSFVTLAEFEKNKMMKKENAVVVIAVVKSPLPTPSLQSPIAMDVLYGSITCKQPSNLRFVLFSARTSSGFLSNPRSYFAPKALLMNSCGPDGLGGSFEECVRLWGGLWMEDDDVVGCRTATTEYRDSDSDFDFDCSMAEVKSEFDVAMESSENIEDFVGKTVVFLNIAARTWEALLFYLLTGFIVFAPEGQNCTAFIQKFKAAYPARPTPVSCKSMYRLADKLGMEELKKRALVHLEAYLSQNTILDEFFSEFTSRHKEVLEMELPHIMKHWKILKASPELAAKIKEVTTGTMEHACAAMMALLPRFEISKS
ncbi:hypothetical protein B0H21DRAFT_192330 [Amylocystis lapponica]|nr:hypothetical protein B0H21DRAFT_192330 [Amylocystis lapponica]